MVAMDLDLPHTASYALFALPDETRLLYARAAHGDLAALTEMRDRFLAGSRNDGPGADDLALLSEMMGRLASTHGRPADQRALAIVLIHRAMVLIASGKHEAAIPLQAEAATLLDVLSSTGDGEAEAILVSMGEQLGAGALAAAGQWSRQIMDRCPEIPESGLMQGEEN